MNMQVQPVVPAASSVSLMDILSVENGAGEGQFVGLGGTYPMPLLYGGHLLGQGLAAALRTVDTDKAANSLHALFLSAGKHDLPIDYQVTRLRDGRNYSARSVEARQNGKLLLTMTVSAKLPEPGDEHQPSMPEHLSASALIAQREQQGQDARTLPISQYGVRIEGVDSFHPASPDFGEPRIPQWVNLKAFENADVHLKQAALAYLSDGTLMFNALRPYGSIATSHAATSLDHTVWFHREPDFSDWILFDQNSPVAADARGLNQGHLYRCDGVVMATVMQESMLKRMS